MKLSHLAVAALLLCASGLSCAADANPKVLSAAEGYRGNALQSLECLVNIDSGTGNEAGLSQIGTIVIDELRKAGAQVEAVSAASAVGNNILATWKGSGKTRILLMAHMDTVFRDGTVRARPFYIKNKRAYGPGVMDDKGGVAAGLYAMRILQRLDFKQYRQVTLLLSANKGTGSKGTRALIEREAKQHDVTLNLEPSRPADGLVVWRKGSGTAEIDAKGKAAHTGVAPESGRNAANELVHRVLQVGKLGDNVKQTTFNVTMLKTGDTTNAISDHATAYADVRVAVPEEFDRVERGLTRVSVNKLVAETEVKTSLARSFPPMPRNAAPNQLAAKAQAIYAGIDYKLTLEDSGDAVDSSLSAGVGMPTLDGFEVVGGGIHTPEEYAEVESVAPRLYLLSRMVMEVAANK